MINKIKLYLCATDLRKKCPNCNEKLLESYSGLYGSLWCKNCGFGKQIKKISNQCVEDEQGGAE